MGPLSPLGLPATIGSGRRIRLTGLKKLAATDGLKTTGSEGGRRLCDPVRQTPGRGRAHCTPLAKDRSLSACFINIQTSSRILLIGSGCCTCCSWLSWLRRHSAIRVRRERRGQKEGKHPGWRPPPPPSLQSQLKHSSLRIKRYMTLAADETSCPSSPISGRRPGGRSAP